MLITLLYILIGIGASNSDDDDNDDTATKANHAIGKTFLSYFVK